MTYDPTIPEQRLLWMLAAAPAGEFDSVLKPKKQAREALTRAKLIEVEKRVKPAAKRKVKAKFLRLTDDGWAWCNANMGWQKPRGKAEQFLDALLRRLKVLFDRQATAGSLADFINGSEPATAPPPEAKAEKPAGPLAERIRAACLELGGGREAVRVRLADLRRKLADVAADDLAAAVRDLSRRRELTLYPLDDPRQITPADAAAAIPSSTGVPQHIVYFGGIAS